MSINPSDIYLINVFLI